MAARSPTQARALFDGLAGRTHASPEAYLGDERLGDFFAQMSACRLGVQPRRTHWCNRWARPRFASAVVELNDYAERLARSAIAAIPDGVYTFEDWMDDDGAGTNDVADTRVAFTSTASAARPISPERARRCAATSIVRCQSLRRRCFTCFVV